jgi:hypothetical protein
LHVPEVPNRAPTQQIAVAAIFGRGIKAFADMLVEKVQKRADRPKPLNLLLDSESREILAES